MMLGTIDKNSRFTIGKEEINTLPIISFQGEIVVAESEEEIEQAVRYLEQFDILGFDTETKPSFKRGVSNKVSLVQISSDEVSVLFRIKRCGITPPLQRLIENPKIKKIGLSLHDDFAMLRKVCNFAPSGFIDLQIYVKAFFIQDMSLQRIYAILFGEKISKSQQLSNWEAETLAEKQKRYAATDAWACLKIYHALRDKNFRFYKLPTPVEEEL